MELNLEAALDAPLALSHRLEVPTGRLERPELLSLEPVEFTGTLQKAEPGFVLAGELSVAGQAICSRCLAPVPFASKGEVSWVLAPAHRRPTEEETELTANDLEVVWYDDFLVPFDPLVEEMLQLEIPLKPLCRPDCLGLCPRCGSDRNTAPCDCREEGDERLAKLKSLLT
ncbi:MAG: YceD family protein [Thermoanaerobaculia bacterium]